ncbi:MAG TPA: S9 family peptidase, partial [Steroidobacteraceae bacterium]
MPSKTRKTCPATSFGRAHPLKIRFLTLALASVAPLAQGQTPATQFDAAVAFGARPSVSALRLSPDGKRVAYVAAAAGQGAVLFIRGLERGASPKALTRIDGKNGRLAGCTWVADDRLVCEIYGATYNPALGALPWTRLVALDADGANPRQLSTEQNSYSRGLQLGGGEIIDWLPDENGAVLMTRHYLPDTHTGSHLGSDEEGLGLDRVDTRTLAVTHVERASPTASDYITDGRGTVRIIGNRGVKNDYDTGVIHYRYRPQNSSDWKPLGDFNYETGEGFAPYAVDRELNVAYGLKKTNGRKAFYSVALDEDRRETLLFSRPDVDVEAPILVGRRQRVVGATFVTDTRQAMYLSPDVRQLLTSLAKALPNVALRVVDSSIDENTMLIFAGSDTDPGVYYIFDRKAHNLETFLVVRSPLEGVKLANVRPISYPGDDGVMIPAYLTLPPGREDAKGLPAIVLPHGGPSARDEWGFDWLSQFFANRGYAVLQPNFRGSSGYGDVWFQQNGFRSWKMAIGDVLAAGHWLVKQEIADPAKLGILGWSYGGYAALQSAVVDSQTFKAVIAVAPVTDLNELKEENRNFTNYRVVSEFIGDGPHVHEGSPVEHADKIKVPVMLFHGGLDTNVNVLQSRRMADRLKAAGGHVEFVTWDDLDHQLEDTAARTEML